MANDLISRVDALEIIEKLMEIHFDRKVVLAKVFSQIKDLPSAQPETIRCKDCKHRREDECPMYHVEWVEYDDDGYIESDDVIYDYTEDDGYCHMAERRTDETD